MGFKTEKTICGGKDDNSLPQNSNQTWIVSVNVLYMLHVATSSSWVKLWPNRNS